MVARQLRFPRLQTSRAGSNARYAPGPPEALQAAQRPESLTRDTPAAEELSVFRKKKAACVILLALPTQ